MTRIIVDPGACGLICEIEAESQGKYKVNVRLKSRCKQINKLAGEVTSVDFLEISKGPFGQNAVSQAAARCSLHASCSVPCAVLKAVEAELGMAVKKDVSFSYDE
jgi:hypothetical protein